MGRITNEEVLEIIRENTSLWKNLKKRRVQMIRNMLRHGELLEDILESEVGTKRGRRKPRLVFFQIMKDICC